MSTYDFCSPGVRYAVFVEGASLISKCRILDVPRKVYVSLKHMILAPKGPLGARAWLE